MRVIRFDEGFRFDDPNSFWGDPSYQLEPGDPGYINTGLEPGATQPKTNHTTMSASNETPRNLKVLLALGHDFAVGLTQLQDVIGMHHHRGTTVLAALAKLEGDPAAPAGSNANKGSQLVFKDCENTLDAAQAAMVALSDGAVKTLLSGYRTLMDGVNGHSYNAGWAAAGFTNNKTAVPSNHGDRLTLLAAMRAYLVAHPTHEGSLPQPSGPALAVTAAAALALHTQFNTARALVNTLGGTQETCKNLRDADSDGLFDEMSGGIAEVRDLLPANDPRWETLGLNIPANPTPPEAVASLTLIPAGTGKELAAWPHARRAASYRIFIKVAGIDVDFRFVDRSQDLEYTIKGLAAGQDISVYVLATNAAGDAPPSPTVTKIVGA